MKSIFQLLKIGFLSPHNLLCIYKTQRKHGKNITMILHYCALRYGNKNAFIENEINVTFLDFYTRVQQLATVIQKEFPGIYKKNVALICNQNYDEIITFFALQWLGVKTLLINDKCHSLDKQKLIDRMDGEVITFALQPQAELNTSILLISQLWPKNTTLNGSISPVKQASKIIFPTSGTTGLSKLISGKQGVFYWLKSFSDLVVRTKIYTNKGVGIAVPFSNGFGYTSVIFAMILGKFQAFLPAAADAQILNNPNIDTLLGVPSALFNYSQAVQNQPHHIVKIISGGNALSKKEFTYLAQTFGHQIFSLYGSTENSVSFLADYHEISLETSALGKPLRGIQYRMVTLPDTGIELEIKSPLANLDSQWYKTGDLVAMNESGLLYWVGRKDRMMIINGLNIYPEEIESKLCQLEYVKDALVMEKPNAEGLNEIVAYVIADNSVSEMENQIKADLKQWLTGLKIPKNIQFVSAFAYTTTGKKQLLIHSETSIQK